MGTPPCTGVFYLFDTFRATAKVSSNNLHKGFWFESLGPEGGEWEATGLDNFRYDGQLHIDQLARSLVISINLVVSLVGKVSQSLDHYIVAKLTETPLALQWK